MRVLGMQGRKIAPVAIARSSLAVVMVAAALAGWCRPAVAESGRSQTLTGAGLELTLDTRWVDAPGYRPVRIAVKPTIPSPMERTLSVELLIRRNLGNDYDLRVAQDIEIPAGSDSVETILSVPHHLMWNSYQLNVVENGRVLKGLSIPSTGVNNSSNQFGDSMPSILIVGAEQRDTGHLASVVPRDEYDRYGNRYSTSVDQNGLAQLPTAIYRPGKDLSENWIDYTSLDVVCLSLEQFEGLDGPQRQAVLQWTHAGGNLWVYGIGEQWERLEQLDGLTGQPFMPPEEQPDPADPDGPPASGSLVSGSLVTGSLVSGPPVPSKNKSSTRGWKFPPEKFFDWGQRGSSSTSSSASWRVRTQVDQQGVGTVRIEREPSSPDARRPSQLDRFDKPHFLLRHYGMGMIVAMAADDPFHGTEGEQEEWGWVFGAVGMHRCLWYQRNGVSMNRENREFWNFLIPGVGLAPVTEFCVLITFFVLAIGPVNYWLLKRWKRLHLLVVTIPVSATTVTLLLFGYAIVADGLATRVRVRSVTRIDQRRGEAACWARLSYYSGLAPSRGLIFSKDIAVLPLEETPSNSDYSSRALRRDVIWGENQWLASGWLSSRTPAQYLTIRSRSTGRGLDLIASDDTSGEPSVKNRLGTPIKQLAICSEEGQWYWAENVAVGATQPLEPIALTTVRMRLNTANFDNQPTTPDGMDQRYRGGIFGMSRRSRYWYRGQSSALILPTQSTGRLERGIGSIGTSSSYDEMSPYEPRSYVAIVESSPEVVLGVASATEESGYHVILGKW
ncbi:MAG: hypothetical protein V3R99_10235 [Thermoguttaceae bacterium]